MNFLVRDTKNPARDPFYTSQDGMDNVNSKEPGRLVRHGVVEVTKLPELVKVPKVEINTPKIKRKGRKPAKQ